MWYIDLYGSFLRGKPDKNAFYCSPFRVQNTKTVSQGRTRSSSERPLLDWCHTDSLMSMFRWVCLTWTKFTGSPQNRSCWQLDHVKALQAVRCTHGLLVGIIWRMNGFIECFCIMVALAKLSSQTVKEEKTKSWRNKRGGSNLSDGQERGSGQLNFLWPLPHWHTDSLNSMQTIKCTFPCALHAGAHQKRSRRTWFMISGKPEKEPATTCWSVCPHNQCCRAAQFKNSWRVWHTVREAFYFTRNVLFTVVHSATYSQWGSYLHFWPISSLSMHHMILPLTSCSQKPTETVSAYHFVSWANESSPLCCVMSAKTTSHGPYGIMPWLIVSCLALH